MKQSKEIRSEIDKIIRQIVAAYQPEKIILFGSYAYGKPSADSDLDLLIIKRTAERFIDRWTNVRKIVSDRFRLNLSFLHLTSWKKDWQEEISSSKRSLQKAKSSMPAKDFLHPLIQHVNRLPNKHAQTH